MAVSHQHAERVLPVHYRDDNPATGQLGQLCDHAGTGDIAAGCPRGCDGARSHYANDGHPGCADDDSDHS